jgi:zinc protease
MVRRDDLVDFHARHFGAARAVIAMIGAISRADAERLAERLTRDLPSGDPAPVREPLPVEPPPGVIRIDHPASQSHLLIGFRGIAQHDPDLLALQLANHVLGGGGFTSRLYAEVREKRGLAYSVYSYFAPRAQAGPFTIGLQTRKDQADEALAVVREALARFVSEGPSAAELEAARANLIAGFPLRIDSNRKILGQLSAIGVHGLPLDWLERWRERVAALTLEQVQAAITRHMHPERLVAVIVGAPQAPAP